MSRDTLSVSGGLRWECRLHLLPCAWARTRQHPQDTKALEPPPDPASVPGAPALPGHVSCFSAWRSGPVGEGSQQLPEQMDSSDQVRDRSKVRQQKQLPDPGPLGTRPVSCFCENESAPPGEQGKDSLCPARGVCCDGGGAETSGWRQRKGRDESTQDPWSPAGRERVKPTPWPACSLRPPSKRCMLWLREPALSV